MSLLDNLRKFLYGSPGMEYGRENLGQMEGSQGLIGTGGESGNGLLQGGFSKMNSGGGLLSNIPEGAMLGAALYSQGLKGKDPLEGFFPAVVQSAQLKKLTTPSKTELQKNLEAAGYTPGSEEYKAALNAYLSKNRQNTLSKEALALYKEGQLAPDFDAWFDKLPKASQDLYNKQVKPTLAGTQAAFEFIEKQEKKLLETSPDLPLKDGAADLSKITPGITYNLNGQVVVYDDKEKKLIPYSQYIKQ